MELCLFASNERLFAFKGTLINMVYIIYKMKKNMEMEGSDKNTKKRENREKRRNKREEEIGKKRKQVRLKRIRQQ